MADYSSLTVEQKAIYIENVLFTQYGITSPGNTTTSREKLQAVVEILRNERAALNSIANSIMSVTGASFDQAISTPVSYSQLPPNLQTQLNRFVPPGYNVNQISIRDIDSSLNVAITNTLAIRDGRQQLPVMGATVNLNVTNTSPPISTVPTPIVPATINTVTQPIVQPPAPNTKISNILTAAAVISGATLLVNAVNSNASPAPIIENTEPATIADPNADEFDGIDEQVAANENILQEPPQLSDEEVNNYFDQFQQEEQIENREPATIEENVFDPGTTFNAGEENVFNPAATGGDSYGSSKGLTGGQLKSRSTATSQDVSNFKQKEDWRVRLSLAPSADYLYKAKTPEARGILDPLAKTDGVIFPYTPAISVQYAAHYDQTELTHSNFKYFQYKSSSVDQVSITCDFTAQDTNEARYVLAVIHFFRSVTKMFYGQDNGPKPGTPPPLCYLSGLGEFQFDAHPLAITAFNYSLPTDVDYIRAGSVSALAGVNQSRSNNPVNSSSAADSRRTQSGLNTGATANGPNWSNLGSTRAPTYVPTKMQMQITAVPIVTRYDISENFSLAKYGTGKLLQGTVRSGGGIW